MLAFTAPTRNFLFALCCGTLALSPAQSFAQDFENRAAHVAEWIGTHQLLEDVAEGARNMADPTWGFSDEYIEAWHEAVAIAFDHEHMKSDLHGFLAEQLTEDELSAIEALENDDAMVAYIQTAEELTVETDEEREAYIARVVQLLEEAPASQNAIYRDIFELQGGPERGALLVETMLRVMEVVSVPEFGAEYTQLMIDAAEEQNLTETYTEQFFIGTVGVFDALSEEHLQAMYTIVSDPVLISYGEGSEAAFAATYHAAIDRLEKTFAETLEAR